MSAITPPQLRATLAAAAIRQAWVADNPPPDRPRSMTRRAWGVLWADYLTRWQASEAFGRCCGIMREVNP